MRRTWTGGVSVMAGVIGLASVAAAQVVVPAPPAPAPTPEYQPPARPMTPPPPPPPAPEVPVPDLVQRDASGRVVEILTPTEEAALAAMKLDDAKKSQRQAVATERRALMQRVVARNSKHALQMRGLLPRLDTINNLGELVGYGDATRALQIQPGLIQNMTTTGAITQREAEAANKAVTNYTQALGKQINDDSGGDRSKSGPTIARVNIRRLTLEAMREFDFLLLECANRWQEIKGRATVEAPADKESALAAAKTDAAKVAAMADLLAAMPEPAQYAVLDLACMPLPAKRQLPDPPVRSGPPKAGEPAK